MQIKAESSQELQVEVLLVNRDLWYLSVLSRAAAWSAWRRKILGNCGFGFESHGIFLGSLEGAFVVGKICLGVAP